MKDNRRISFRRIFPSNLFDRARNKLTLQYSLILISFLGLFVFIVYAVLYWLIWSDQRDGLRKLADSEIGLLQKWADADDNPHREPPPEVAGAFALSSDQSFYYLVAMNGKLELGNELRPELREQVMLAASEGHFHAGKVQSMTFLSSMSLSGNEQHAGSKEERFLVTKRELASKGVRIGTLYIGKDVTFQHELFRWLRMLLVGTASLFFVLALWISHILSRRAIIPIARAYERQREFVGDASHELRTPLSVMQTSIEALQLEESVDRDPFVKKVLLGLKEEVGGMTKLAGGLLQLARSDWEEMNMERSSFDVGEISRSVIQKLMPMAQEKQIAITLQVEEGLMVHWDKDKFTQLLVLLADNAIKYTEDGGAVAVKLGTRIERADRYLQLEVKDNGIGIAADALPHIFERFYRQDKSRTRRTGGHGLGLAIAKQIVNAGHGTIEVESVEGEGSLFRVRIPLQEKS